ncbi:MAG: hypothetical protein A2487_07415 [Candidatus Raymondbacteria bacterium RifOxyC12_full_50_8]|uniref:Redox-sensing transcriptional repressor Rex n=1 Tax=Candidatus Raymondbacteria bacterium RIFOXYD12_FULL_49_13 TaxID=1817890 RepID=A0A1F7F9I6_UNCRA|nr:MAG: hypothetical protein A2350_06840 [Candidatus Raymondbacteria bacterium RifOxyB12_full_50_8]OGJ93210.1 MAG: hypothetical protein A2248_17720 [Candidatus Raymondbacteria bacterium RIFOXYA2_FULL_49_16]OGJ99429.1 MAG: hypothetical protein A2487_07415 [Candidatus Raymondbacteria bacterium RifOxyC12_full_50_8]OGK03293.1 MAG: hypothetical protein A2519_15065 [Candidatus Raymondbacteria bacterium RIFOXYD12_FULL_49_13]OGP44932.1 MAG: hypothetical protein A2324_19645 [Candidatus Raymondbacteria b
MHTNKNCIQRMSRYRNALNRFKGLGFSKIFSNYLADAVGSTSSQVRKDFSLFGIYGSKRGGYSIDCLIEQLNEILGKNELQKVVLAGFGNMGAALVRYKGFSKEGISILAAFDIDPAKYNKRINNIEVLPLDRLQPFVQEHQIKIGILGVPEIAAQHVLDLMVAAGIRGVLNFAPIQLKCPAGCVVNSVTLEHELENVIYFVNANEKTEGVAA